MADIATLQSRLAEAEAAYHQLQTGRRVVRVKVDGYETDFTPARSADLLVYIARLKSEIAGNNPTGAIGIVF